MVPIELPPLRQRIEDIPELCRHFLHQIAKRENSPFRHIEPEALRLLQRYPWPGNVRELQNIVERACVLETEPGVIRAATIEPWLQTPPRGDAAVEDLAGKPLADIEKQVILSHTPAVQRPSHQDRRRTGHRRANAGHEAEAMEGRRRVGRGIRRMNQRSDAGHAQRLPDGP